MDFMGMVGDVSFSTGSVQTVRQIRKVVVNETDVTTRRSAFDRESLHPRAPSSNGSEFSSVVMRERERERERNSIEEQQRVRDTPPPLPARNRMHSRHIETQTRPGTMTVDTQTSVLTDNDVHLRHPPPSSSSTTSSRSASAAVQCGMTFNCCCEQHGHGSAHIPVGAQCSCCPFGYHIAVDFVEFAATNKPNGQSARFSTQLDSIKRRSEQLARTRDFLNEHDSLRARVALASAKVPPSPSSDELAVAAAANNESLAREIGSALDVTIDQFATNGRLPVHHQAHAHTALDCPICARRVPIVTESQRPDDADADADADAVSSSKFSVSRRSQQTADEVFEEPISTGHFEIVERYEIIPRVEVEVQQQREAAQTYDTDVESQSTRRSVPHQHQCDHSACEARCSSLVSQLAQLEEALRIAEQEKRITETKLTILTKQYAESMMTTRMRIDRAVATDDWLHGTTTRDTQTDAPSLPSPAAPLNTPRNIPPRRTVGVGDADVNDVSFFVVTCERCEEYRRRPRRHVDLQTETSVRNVATYYRPPTRDVGIGYTLDDSPLRPATRECDIQTDACELESDQFQMEFTSESVSEFIRTFTSSVETSVLNSTSMLRLLRAITAHMTTTEFHALFRAAFRRDVRSVELQASPRCYSVASAVDRTDFEKEAACGEDYHRLEIPRLSSSFAVQCQPSYHHKYIWTESPITFDVGSVTSDVDIRNRATQTYAALTVATAAQTDRSVTTASYKCEVALSSCPNVPKRDADSGDNDESYTFDEHEHVTVVVNGVVETRCVREVRSLSSSTHSHNDQLIAASYRTCLSSATETPAENERDEAFVSRPNVAHRLVIAGVPMPVPIPRTRSASDSDSEAENQHHDHQSARYSSSRSTTQTQFSNVFATSTIVMHSSADDTMQDASADDSDELAMAAPNGSPRATKKSILKKGSKTETPVQSPICSPTRPKRSITFATKTLVVGSSESSDGDSTDESDSMRAVVYTDQIRETPLVDFIAMADGPILSVAYSHFGQEEVADDDVEDEETCTSVRNNTVLNSYSAFSDLSDINDTRDQNARDKLSSSPTKFQLPSEVRKACETVESWLEEPDRADLKEQIDSCMQMIAADWFRLLTEPSRDTVELLEDYLRALNDDYSSDLVERVVRLTDAAGNTALHYALWKQQFDVVDLLLSTDACECDALNLAGYSPIMLAAECKPRSEEHREVLRRIFENGDVNQRSRSVSNQQDAASYDVEFDGPTALFVAAAHGEPDVVRLMLECGANPNANDKCGSTALHCAAEHGHPDSVNALVSAGADVNARDADGSTPLHCAAERGDVQIMRLLLADPRCDLLIRNRTGHTPLDVARTQEQWDVVALLEAGIEL